MNYEAKQNGMQFHRQFSTEKIIRKYKAALNKLANNDLSIMAKKLKCKFDQYIFISQKIISLHKNYKDDMKDLYPHLIQVNCSRCLGDYGTLTRSYIILNDQIKKLKANVNKESNLENDD